MLNPYPCPFASPESQHNLVSRHSVAVGARLLVDDGSVICRSEKEQCCRFFSPASADLRGGPKHNFQVCNALDFLA